MSGRIQSVRTAGNKLLFMDLKQGDSTVQVLCQYGKLQKDGGIELETFKNLARVARKGDWYEALGLPHRSSRGELSVMATTLPKLLAPSLHQIPDTLEDAETRARKRHVDMLINPEIMQTLQIRHAVERQLDSYFSSGGFTKVSTPILTSGAGGAIARPFETSATELEGQKLNLRIAPELWLKRLIVGGMDKVYEIGPAFRNEGVDATHNPEFYTCEFYEAFATLENLIAHTEDLLDSMSNAVKARREEKGWDLPDLTAKLAKPYRRLEFIPTIESELKITLPDLLDPSAQERVFAIFEDHNLAVPAKPTLLRLLDALASEVIEPLCKGPTFIMHHPACLSPLSLHFTCPSTGQTVAARAELFIDGREYANMYEEENSPIRQRQKFQDQLRYRKDDGEVPDVDESYLEALEWGLPPTGGWGCGIDRLVMLFAGRERIADVLAFGSLRNVVGLGRRRG